MNTNMELNRIRSDDLLRNDFIEKYTNFILSSASKATGKFISKDDDEFSVALLAFNEAITRYDDEKGEFFAFASRVIHSRIIDEHRKSQKGNVMSFSFFESENEDGKTEQFDVVGNKDVLTDGQIEIMALKQELNGFGITFMELTKCSPKFRKTKNEVFKVINFIINNDKALKTIINDGKIPASLVIENTGVNKKVLERHRKYIIASVIILTGDYPFVSSYLKNIKGVCI